MVQSTSGAGVPEGYPAMVDPDSSLIPNDPLLARAVCGDRLALNELLLDQFDTLEEFIARRTTAIRPEWQSTEDLLQETFVRAIRGIRDFKPSVDGTFDGWLKTIAQNVVHTAAAAQAAKKRGGGYRRQRNITQSGDSSLTELVDLLADKLPQPSSVAARYEMLKALHVSIAELPNDQRDAVLERYVRGQSIAQTADSLGRTTAAVRGLLHRAKSHLRGALGRSSRWFNRK